MARFTDAGTAGNGPADWDWALAGGGDYADNGAGLALANGGIYVTGYVGNSAVAGDPNGFANVQFGSLASPGQGPSLNSDAYVARATDAAAGGTPTWAWLLTGGGANTDQANSVAVRGSRVYTAAVAMPAATFGTVTLPAESGYQVAVLGMATDNTVLGVRPDAGAAPAGTARLYPNPAAQATTLAGAPSRTAGQVFDVLGRVVATFITDAAGAATILLPPGQARGVYVVRAGSQALRLAIE